MRVNDREAAPSDGKRVLKSGFDTRRLYGPVAPEFVTYRRRSTTLFSDLVLPCSVRFSHTHQIVALSGCPISAWACAIVGEIINQTSLRSVHFATSP
jgi:hypothetical protein